MKKVTIILLLACLPFTSCVSIKKYRKVVDDLQSCYEYQRAYEQWERIEKCEKMDKERLKKEEDDE